MVFFFVLKVDKAEGKHQVQSFIRTGKIGLQNFLDFFQTVEQGTAMNKKFACCLDDIAMIVQLAAERPHIFTA